MEKYIYDHTEHTQYLFENPLDIITLVKDLTKDLKSDVVADRIDNFQIHGLTLLESIYVSKELWSYMSSMLVPAARMQYLIESRYRNQKTELKKIEQKIFY